jgi:hypothetical protein
VKIPLIYTIASHHKPSNSHSVIPGTFIFEIISDDIFGKNLETPKVLLDRKDIKRPI